MKLRTVCVIAVPVLLLAVSLLFGSVLLLRLCIATVLVIGISFLWTRASLRRLTATAAAPPEHLQVGDSFRREVTVSNPDKFPRLWVGLRDNADLPGPRDTAITTIAGRSSYTWKTAFTCTKRGLYHLGPTTVSATDPLGIFGKERTLGERQNVTVYPATLDLPLFRFASFSDFGYGSGYQSISRISPNASSVREYASGDSLHHIHWKSTARTGNLMVKMFDADRSYNASKVGWVLLDMNEDSHFGQQDAPSEEMAITVAASIVRKYLQGGMRVGFMASDEHRSFLPAERGEERLWEILRALAVARSDWKTKFGSVVLERMDSFRDNPLVIMVATSATEGLLETIRQLRNKVDSVVVVLIDIASFGGRPAAADIMRPIAWAGAQVYIVKNGDRLAQALDSKATRTAPVPV